MDFAQGLASSVGDVLQVCRHSTFLNCGKLKLIVIKISAFDMTADTHKLLFWGKMVLCLGENYTALSVAIQQDPINSTRSSWNRVTS